MISTLPFPLHFSPISSPKLHQFPLLHLPHKTLIPKSNPNRSPKMVVRAESLPSLVSTAVNLLQSNPATWKSALLSNLLIFVVGSPILVSGLSVSGIASAFLLGTLTWRAFGPSGFLLVATYFVIVRLCSLLLKFYLDFVFEWFIDWWGLVLFSFSAFSWIELAVFFGFEVYCCDHEIFPLGCANLFVVLLFMFRSTCKSIRV